MKTKLTHDILIDLGFENTRKDFINRPIYHMIVPKDEYGYFHYEIEVQINDYPSTNGNCGIVSLYTPVQKCGAIPPDLLKKKEWTDEDRKRAISYEIDLPEFRRPIAWHVDNLERLKLIYLGLTNQELNFKDNLKQLKQELNEAIEKEHFEIAAEIRLQIKVIEDNIKQPMTLGNYCGNCLHNRLECICGQIDNN